MTTQSMLTPLPTLMGLDGKPLTDGSVYIGQANLDPRSFPSSVYFDAALTIPATQPLKTTAGYIHRNGSPTNIWLDQGLHSMLVIDSAGRQVFYAPAWTGSMDTTIHNVTVNRFSGTGALATYTLTVTPASSAALDVYVNGIYQQKNTYTLAGASLSINAPSGSSNIEAVISSVEDFTAVSSTLAGYVATADASADAAAISETNAAASKNAAAASATAAAASATAADASADAAALSEAQAAAIVLGDFVQSGTGAVARTFTSKVRERVSILDFIPVAEHAAIAARTSTYDCSAAMSNAIAAGYRILCPAGTYHFDSTINIKKCVIIEGEAGAMTGGEGASPPTVFDFARGIVGIFIHRINTTATASGVPSIVSSTTGADGAILRNLTLFAGDGESATGDLGHHGVWLKARALLDNVQVMRFNGNGIHIVAAAATADATLYGNANNWVISGGSRSVYNGGHGLYVDADDANAGVSTGLDCSSNLGWGVFDSSFLGNTYIGTHTAANGLGAFKTDNVNACSVFLGSYEESGQPVSQFSHPTLVLGGTHMAPSTSSTGTRVDATSAGLEVSRPVYSSTQVAGKTQAIGMGYTSSDGTLMWYQHTDAPNRFAWRWDTRTALDLSFGYASSGSNDIFKFTGPNTAFLCGRSAGVPYAAIAHRLWIGNQDSTSDAARQHLTGTAVPTTGEWARGDVIYNMNASIGGFMGWICTTGGTPGTWATFGEVMGSGGTVVQTTSKTTGVTLNARTGQINMEATTSIAAGAVARFALTNSTIGSNDVITVLRKSGGTNGAYQVWADQVTGGSCGICVQNITGGALAEAVILQFRVITGAG